MRRIAFKGDRADNETAYRVQRLTTVDVACSLKKFIERYYTGCICFGGTDIKNRPILFDQRTLAFMIKCVLGELALRRVCEIGFATGDDEFLISFKTGESSLPDELTLLRLRAAATKYGVNLYTEERTLIIGIPTLEKALISLYEKPIYRFLYVLEEIFSEEENG